MFGCVKPKIDCQPFVSGLVLFESRLRPGLTKHSFGREHALDSLEGEAWIGCGCGCGRRAGVPGRRAAAPPTGVVDGAMVVRIVCKGIFSHNFFYSNFYSVIVTFVTIIGEGERRFRETWCGRRYGRNRGDKEAENRRRGVSRDDGKYKKGQNFSLPQRLFKS